MEDWNPHNAYEQLRDEIRAELIAHWKTPLPPNPTPLQECRAWEADMQMIVRAHDRVRVRRAQEAFDRAAANLAALGG